jgi:hypothetical protein
LKERMAQQSNVQKNHNISIGLDSPPLKGLGRVSIGG